MLGVILQGLSFFAILASFGPTFWHGYKWKRANPEKLGFRWGYFVAYSTMLFYVFVFGGLIVFWVLDPPDEGFDEGFKAVGYLLVLLAGVVALSYMAIKRRRWALVLVTLLTLNPLWMIINVFYLKNRWGEFGEEAAGRRAIASA